MNDIEMLILDRAKARFDRFGYKKTTMDEISSDCKISKKTLYAYFRDKENLFDCLILRESNKAQIFIFAHIQEIEDPVDRLTNLIRISLEYFTQDNFLTRLLKDEDALYSAFLQKKYRHEVEETLITSIAEIIEQGQQSGKIRDVDARISAYAGLKLFQSFSYMRTIDFDQEKYEQGYYTSTLTDFIMQGLVAKA